MDFSSMIVLGLLVLFIFSIVFWGYRTDYNQNPKLFWKDLLGFIGFIFIVLVFPKLLSKIPYNYIIKWSFIAFYILYLLYKGYKKYKKT